MRISGVVRRWLSTLSPAYLSCAMAATLLAIASLLAVLLVNSYREQYREAEQNVTNVAAVLSEDLRQEIQGLDLSLLAAVDGWRDERVLSMDPGLRQMVLFDRSATRQDVGSIFIVGPTGKGLMEAGRDEVRPFDVADRAYFRAHRDQTEAGLLISEPLRSRLDNDWFVGLSRRLNNADGSFGGVVLASISLNHIRQIYARVALGSAGAIGLVGIDGQIVLNLPFDEALIGRMMPSMLPASVFGHVSGTFEAASPIDGLQRIVAFHRIGTLPFIQLVAVSHAEIFAEWWAKAVWVIAGFALLALVVALLTAAFMLELRRRTAAEAELALAARTDVLTGLGNRRCLDEALRYEWQRTVRSKATCALLMIDVDLFKDFNDRYGHGAGDAALSAIGRVIREHLRDPIDVGARYGGEEFCIILADASLQEAMRLADAIQAAIAALAIPHQRSPHGQVSVSMGVAIGGEGAIGSPTQLMASADDALYRAKEAGRNRTVAADSRQGKLAA